MDGDLTITTTVTPSAALTNTSMVTGLVFIATDRMLTEEEKNILLSKDFPKDNAPAATGYSLTYMNITGIDAEAPIESKFEPSCTKANEENMPEDADPLTLCGWTETEPFALDADSKMVSGTAKRPLDVADWELKEGSSYDALTMAIHFDFAGI